MTSPIGPAPRKRAPGGGRKKGSGSKAEVIHIRVDTKRKQAYETAAREEDKTLTAWILDQCDASVVIEES